MLLFQTYIYMKLSLKIVFVSNALEVEGRICKHFPLVVQGCTLVDKNCK